MKTSITSLTLLALVTSSAFAALKAPLPEFKNEKQLAEWRAEKASQSNTRSATSDGSAFYTGKPYLASSGSYSFKYRAYNPEMARWTPEDPSGFPDGANGSIYAPNPMSEVDYMGLSAINVAGQLLGDLGTWGRDQIDELVNGKEITLPVPGTSYENPWNAHGQAQVSYTLSGEFQANATILGTGFEGRVQGTNTATNLLNIGYRISLDSVWNVRSIGTNFLITHVTWRPVFTKLPE